MEISQKQLMMCHKLKTYCWYLMVVLCAILDFIDSLQAKNCAGATHWPISQWGVQYIQSWGHWGHISDLRWIFWAPNRREHTISASVPSSEIEPNKHFFRSAEKARKTVGAEYSLLVLLCCAVRVPTKACALKDALEVQECNDMCGNLPWGAYPKETAKRMCLQSFSFFQMESLHNKYR